MVKAYYPKSLYEVDASPLIDLTKAAEQERLTASGLKAFFKMMHCWKLHDDDARVLLGGVGHGTFYNYKKSAPKKLAQDVLVRISLLIGIFKSLNILHRQDLADMWVTLPNDNSIFKGQTPIDYMKKGGIPALLIVRRLLDARRGAR